MVLAYVNDLVSVAKTEEEMRVTLERFMSYLHKEEQVLNVRKLKMLVFQKRGRSQHWIGNGDKR